MCVCAHPRVHSTHPPPSQHRPQQSVVLEHLPLLVEAGLNYSTHYRPAAFLLRCFMRIASFVEDFPPRFATVDGLESAATPAMYRDPAARSVRDLAQRARDLLTAAQQAQDARWSSARAAWCSAVAAGTAVRQRRQGVHGA